MNSSRNDGCLGSHWSSRWSCHSELSTLVDHKHIQCAYTGHLFFPRLVHSFFVYSWLGFSLYVNLIWQGSLPVLSCEIGRCRWFILGWHLCCHKAWLYWYVTMSVGSVYVVAMVCCSLLLTLKLSDARFFGRSSMGHVGGSWQGWCELASKVGCSHWLSKLEVRSFLVCCLRDMLGEGNGTDVSLLRRSGGDLPSWHATPPRVMHTPWEDCWRKVYSVHPLCWTLIPSWPLKMWGFFLLCLDSDLFF